MNRNSLKRVGAAAFFFLLAGCSQKTAIQFTKPAEIDVGGIKRIAIMDFRGPENSGSNAAAVFASKLFETGFYTIVERSELQKILEEHALSLSGVVDPETAVQAGNVLGVQGVIVGDVISYRCEDRRGREQETRQVWTGEYEKDRNGNDVYEKNLFGKKVKKKKYKDEIVNVEVLTREANVSLGFRLIEVETGQVIASREASHSYQKKLKGGESSPLSDEVVGQILSNLFKKEGGDKLPPKDEILIDLGLRCINDFVRALAPHQETAYAEFAGGGGEVDKGTLFAKNGLWDKAQQVWQQVVEKDPGNHAAWYNLGLALEAQGAYLEAQEAYDRAVSLNSKKLYIKGLKRIRERLEDERRLKEQLQKQNQAEQQPAEEEL